MNDNFSRVIVSPSMERYLEDFEPGQRYRSGRLRVEIDQIKRFAADYDPQPFHLDDGAAQTTLFGGLAASGWHTTALTMRLLVESDFRPVGGIIGVSFEGQWLKPVRPDDELELETEVLGKRQSRSNPGRGFVTVQVSTINQRAEVVQLSKFVLLVPARGGAAPASN